MPPAVIPDMDDLAKNNGGFNRRSSPGPHYATPVAGGRRLTRTTTAPDPDPDPADEEEDPHELPPAVVLDMQELAGNNWGFNRTNTPEPHYAILAAYTRRDKEAAERDLVHMFSSRLGDSAALKDKVTDYRGIVLPARQVEIDRSRPTDWDFTTATYYETAHGVGMRTFNHSKLSALSLAVLLGFNDLANLLLDHRVVMSHTNATHPLIVLLLALVWNEKYTTGGRDAAGNMRAVNNLALRLLRHTPDEILPSIAAPTIPRVVVRGIQYVRIQNFVSALSTLYDRTRIILPQVMIATLDRPCNPTSMDYLVKSGDVTRTKYNPRWNTIETLMSTNVPGSARVVEALINHPSVGKFLAMAGEVDRHKLQVYQFVCERVRENPALNRLVLDSAARFDPSIQGLSNYCKLIRPSYANWRDPDAVHVPSVPLASAQLVHDGDDESASDHVAVVPESDVQLVPPPAYGTVMSRYYIPNTGPSVRIPSRFKGGRQTTRVGDARTSNRSRYVRRRHSWRATSRGIRRPTWSVRRTIV